MHDACECGMALERPRGRTGCDECGAPTCRSCAIKVEAGMYCRWCATLQAA